MIVGPCGSHREGRIHIIAADALRGVGSPGSKTGI